MDFKEWESKCNDLMIQEYGLSIDDLPDQAWYSWWKSGTEIKEAVETAIEYTNNGEWI